MLFWFASQCLFIAVLSRSRSFGCTVCFVRNLLIIFMMRSSLYECRCIPLLCMLRFQVFFSRLGVHCIGSITRVGVLQKWQFNGFRLLCRGWWCFHVFISRLGAHSIVSILHVGALQKWQHPAAPKCFAGQLNVIFCICVLYTRQALWWSLAEKTWDRCHGGRINSCVETNGGAGNFIAWSWCNHCRVILEEFLTMASVAWWIDL